LRVIWVKGVASGSRNAVSWAGVANTTALSPFGGSGSVSTGGGGRLGGGGLRRGGGGLSRSGGGLSRRGGGSLGRGGSGLNTTGGSGGSCTSGATAGASGISESGAEFTESDVGVDDGCTWVRRLKFSWNTRAVRASTTSDTRSSWVSSGWVWGIEPEQVDCVVVPEGQDENVSTFERLAHSLETSQSLKVVLVTKDGLLLIAVVVADVVGGGNSGPVGVGVGDGDAILDVESLNTNEVTRGSTGVSDELGYNGENLGGINGQSWTVEGGITHTVGVEITTVFVANTVVSIIANTASGVRVAHGQTNRVANVRSKGSRDGVGFPEIHLIAASTVVSGTGVGVIGGWLPSIGVGLTSDEFDITWALRVAVTSSIFGTSSVCWVLGETTISLHLGEVDGTVKTARQLANINIEGDFHVQWLEDLVGRLSVHQVDTRSNVGAVGVWSDEAKSEGIATGADTIGGLVGSTFENAVGSAGDIIRAQGGIPSVSSVAVSVAALVVNPSPVSVKDDLGALGNATTSLGA